MLLVPNDAYDKKDQIYLANHRNNYDNEIILKNQNYSGIVLQKYLKIIKHLIM
jgi:hypothetical protein